MAALGLALGVLCLHLVFTQHTSVIHFVTNTPVIDQSQNMTLLCFVSVSAPHTNVTGISIMMDNGDDISRVLWAFIYDFYGEIIMDSIVRDIDRPHVTGEIYDNNKRGYLMLTWKNPGPDQTGYYNCSVGTDKKRVSKGLTISL